MNEGNGKRKWNKNRKNKWTKNNIIRQDRRRGRRGLICGWNVKAKKEAPNDIIMPHNALLQWSDVCNESVSVFYTANFSCLQEWSSPWGRSGEKQM
jgi:hypothetical protein